MQTLNSWEFTYPLLSLINGIYGLTIQFIWIFITMLIGYILMNKSLKRVAVQGG